MLKTLANRDKTLTPEQVENFLTSLSNSLDIILNP